MLCGAQRRATDRGWGGNREVRGVWISDGGVGTHPPRESPAISETRSDPETFRGRVNPSARVGRPVPAPPWEGVKVPSHLHTTFGNHWSPPRDAPHRPTGTGRAARLRGRWGGQCIVEGDGHTHTAFPRRLCGPGGGCGLRVRRPIAGSCSGGGRGGGGGGDVVQHLQCLGCEAPQRLPLQDLGGRRELVGLSVAGHNVDHPAKATPITWMAPNAVTVPKPREPADSQPREGPFYVYEIAGL